jgi:hypothetical protein
MRQAGFQAIKTFGQDGEPYSLYGKRLNVVGSKIRTSGSAPLWPRACRTGGAIPILPQMIGAIQQSQSALAHAQTERRGIRLR